MAKENISMWYEFFNQPTNQNLYDFFMEFNVYLKCGIDYIDALNDIAQGTENKIMKNALVNVARHLDDGFSLADSLAREKKIFPLYSIAAIRAGEESGTLPYVIEILKEYLKYEIKISTKFNKSLNDFKRGFGAITIVFVIYSLVIVPYYEKTFITKGTNLPLISKVIYGGVHFINDYWIVISMVLTAIYFIAKRFFKMYPESLDKVKFKIPYYNKLYYYLIQYRIITMLNILLKSGVPVEKSLEYLAVIVDNKIYADIFNNTARSMVNGNLFYLSLQENDNTKKVHLLIKNLIRTGENTGTLHSTLEDGITFYKDKMNDTIEWFAEKVSFVTLVTVAVFVVVLYIALFAPQFAAFKAARGR